MHDVTTNNVPSQQMTIRSKMLQLCRMLLHDNILAMHELKDERNRL